MIERLRTWAQVAGKIVGDDIMSLNEIGLLNSD
jgi:hypothetical protein